MNIPVFRSAYLFCEIMFRNVASLKYSEHQRNYSQDMLLTNCEGVAWQEQAAQYSYLAIYLVKFSQLRLIVSNYCS